MTKLQILKKSFEITSTKVQLWMLGIFLSSGFGLHWWYGLSWAKNSGWLTDLVEKLFSVNQVSSWLVALLIFGLGLVVLNVIKLYFLFRLHALLHSTSERTCSLCVKIEQKQNVSSTTFRRAIIWRTCLASLITIGLTSTIITLFNLYSNYTEPNVVTQTVLLASLVLVLIVISLWNLVTVMLILFHQLPFAKAAVLGWDLIVLNAKKVAALTSVLGAIFLVAVTAGALVIMRIPAIIGNAPLFLVGQSFLNSWDTLFTLISLILLVIWLVLNNLFFNISLVILFDSLIKAVKSGEREPVMVIAPSNPAVSQSVIIEP